MLGRMVLGDPSLMDFSGHCFEYMDALQTVLDRRGIPAAWLGNRAIRSHLADSTGAIGVFTYWCDARPVPRGVDAGSKTGRNWVRRTHEQAIRTDLDEADARLVFTADDVLLINSFRHWPLRGLVDWLEGRAPAKAPRIVLVLHFTAYPNPEDDDGTAAMYVEGFQRIAASPMRNRFALFADAEELIEEYREMSDLTVHLAPIPHTMPAEALVPRFKSDQRLVISYVGEARENKGFHLLPHVVEGFRRAGLNGAARFNIQSFIHNPKDMLYRRSIGRLDDTNVSLFPDQMDKATYHGYLASADIVLLPYTLDNYYKQTSGIFAEALSLGKPTIVPRGSWMARQVKAYGGGLLFNPSDPQSLLDSAAEAVATYPALKQQARGAATRWNEFNTAENFLAVILNQIESAPS